MATYLLTLVLRKLLLVQGGEGGAFLLGEEGVFGVLALFTDALALLAVVDGRFVCVGCGRCYVCRTMLVPPVSYQPHVAPHRVPFSSGPQRVFVLLLSV